MLSRGAAPGHNVLDVAPGAQPGTSVVRVRQPDGMRWVASSADGALRHLFRINASAPPSDASAVSVGMYGSRYWIPRLDVDDTDRTLKAVAFLDQLIALQTSSGSLNVTPTLISVPSG